MRQTTSKAELIREAISANPNIKTEDLVQSLAQRGIKVSKAHIYTVKGQMKKTVKVQKVSGRLAASQVSASNGHAEDGSVNTNLLIRVNGLVREYGATNVESCLGVLERIGQAE